MAYYQAHLLLLAGYSQFFVSGLVLPQPAFDDDAADMAADMERFMDEDESPESEPVAVDEPCSRFAATDDDDDDDDDVDFDVDAVELLTPATLASPVPEQRRRKRLSVVSESHVRTMSRWLLDSAISLGDRQQQHPSAAESLRSPREVHETKRFCLAARRPRLPSIQTSFTCMPPRLSVS
ncbi:uncharacterized protein BKCO1_5000042 [Diplodia corticola]|uniref:Uncharacterized protein n=1 Tax=Diplodia corticola TaxID=236234 RepID=A0A1J9RFJ9_9PEZI|nr:uncharacterized protein BKCO1_5000042 [Diplodia corticola]OJD31315.1 hypothetical protein BKCO1_5000042 [Diplodia corticola]